MVTLATGILARHRKSKLLTFYNFRLACHNQTKLSLSLPSQAGGGVKLEEILTL